MLAKMDTSSYTQTSKVLPLSRTNCVSEEIIEFDLQGESPLATLASDLVNEWLNQALDNFQLTFGDIFCQSDSCSRNGNRNENQAASISSDTIVSSVPCLKQLCCKALETSDNHLMNLADGQFYGEEKQAHDIHMNGTETFLCHSTKEVEPLESNYAGNHSQHNSASSNVKMCDFSKVHNLLVTDTDKAERNAVKVSHEVSQNVNVIETLDHIQTCVSHLLPTAMWNTASFTTEAMSDSFNASVNSSLDCISGHRLGLIDSQDRSENIVYKVTNSSSDTFLTDDWNSTNNGGQMCLFGPEVQVSFLYFQSHCFTLIFHCSCLGN